MTTNLTGARAFARIDCNEAAASTVYWVMAAVLPLLAFAAIWIAGVPFRFDVPAREFNPLVFLPVVASVAGLFFLAAGVFMTLRLRKFGASTLTIDKRPRVGGRLQGRVTCTVDVRPQGDWRLVLQCVERIKAAGSRQRVYQTDLTRWEFKTTLPALTSIRDGIPVDIAIPEHCLALTDPVEIARQKRGELRWVLQMKGPREGLDFQASFLVPVKTDRSG